MKHANDDDDDGFGEATKFRLHESDDGATLWFALC